MVASVQELTDGIAQLPTTGADAVTPADVERLRDAVRMLNDKLNPADAADDVVQEATPHRSG